MTEIKLKNDRKGVARKGNKILIYLTFLKGTLKYHFRSVGPFWHAIFSGPQMQPENSQADGHFGGNKCVFCTYIEWDGQNLCFMVKVLIISVSFHCVFWIFGYKWTQKYSMKFVIKPSYANDIQELFAATCSWQH